MTVGLIFFYKPSWILRFNKFARERVFNDDVPVMDRRKKGAVFVLMSFVILYWAYYRAQYSPSRITEPFVSADRLLYQSLQHLNSREYVQAKNLCSRVLYKDPTNAEALYQLSAAQYLLNDTADADETWKKAQASNATAPEAEQMKKLIERQKLPATGP